MKLHLIAAILALATTAAPHSSEHPESARGDIVATAVADGRFSTLATALEAASLVEALQGAGPFTVFAPTDTAFAALPSATLQALLEPRNRDQLAQVLKLHVVAGRLTGVDALAAGSARTLTGERLHFGLNGARLQVANAGVVLNDVEASNGLIHVIDRVLLPEGGLELRPQGRLVIGVVIEKPSKALASQLRTDRDASLIVESVTRESPAERAGLQPFDLILSIDGAPANETSLRAAKQRVGAGGHPLLSILRGGVPRSVEVGVGIEAH